MGAERWGGAIATVTLWTFWCFVILSSITLIFCYFAQATPFSPRHTCILLLSSGKQREPYSNVQLAVSDLPFGWFSSLKVSRMANCLWFDENKIFSLCNNMLTACFKLQKCDIANVRKCHLDAPPLVCISRYAGCPRYGRTYNSWEYLHPYSLLLVGARGRL